MPFNWQPFGALQGAVPNQMPAMTGKNQEGLGVGGGQTMFNLPRFQMPGSSVNFSISRTASSDPIKNIISDISNPLGGTSISVGGGEPPQQAPSLKQKMMANAPVAGSAGGMVPEGAQMLAAQAPAMSAMHLAGNDTAQYAYSDPVTPMRPFVLRQKMMQPQALPLGPMFS